MSIGIPITAWCGINLIIEYREEAFKGIWSFLSYYRIVMGSSLWFLWAILGCSLLIIGIKYFFRDSVFAYAVFLIVSPFISDAHYLAAIKFLYPYFAFGYLFNRFDAGHIMRKEFWERKKHILMMLVITYILLLMLFHKDTYYYTTGITVLGKENIGYQLWNDVLRLIAGFIGCFAAIGSMAVFMGGEEKGWIWSHFVNVLEVLGRYTLGIYIINIQTISFLQRITSGLSYGIGIVIVETIIVTGICLMISLVLYRVRWVSGLLFGKWW